ncbi:hypothetical protein SELMODRAFT_430524 [Selaginella moellendorffii]|uniref:Endonuclease/exonuclease/phosphatase domain-containing protein n=1 Tax=Selaginella moellendorffii TaxID=88036 RepID=D8T9N9_SELML|nr:hypothetical protein SELMODRAFT_430524 [Selaginella moellendorffii]
MITHAPLTAHPAYPDTIQNLIEDEEPPEAVPAPRLATKNMGMKLSIKLKQHPLPPPKPDAPLVEKEPDTAQPTSNPTPSPAFLADTVKVPRKKPMAKNLRKPKGGTAASSSRQAPATRSIATPPMAKAPPLLLALEGLSTYGDEGADETQGQPLDSHAPSPTGSDLILNTQQRDQVIQALLGEQSTDGAHHGSQTPKGSAQLTALVPRLSIGTSSGPTPPTIPLAKMKELEVLYLGWMRVEELHVEVDKAASNRSNAAPTLSNVTTTNHTANIQVLLLPLPAGSQKETIHRPTMELDLIIDDPSETNNTPVFLAMMVEGFAQYLGKKATQEESGGQLIHVLFIGKAPISYKIQMLGKSHLDTLRAASANEAWPHGLEPRGDHPAETKCTTPGVHRAGELPQLLLKMGSRSTSPTFALSNPTSTGTVSGSVHPIPCQGICLQVLSAPTGPSLDACQHLTTEELPDQGLQAFFQASEIINDIQYRVKVDKCTIVGSNMHLYAALLTKSGIIPEHRIKEHHPVSKLSLGEHYWNPARNGKRGTLIIAKGPLQSLCDSHQILIPRRAHVVTFKIHIRAHFLRKLTHRLPLGIDDWLLIGDLNFVDHKADKEGGILTDHCTRAKRLAWNSLLLHLGTCDAYEIPSFAVHEPQFTWQERQRRCIQRQLDRFYLTMELCMQGGKLDIDTSYPEFSYHCPIRLILPLQRSLGPKKPSAIPRKFFMDPANNL